MDILLIEKDPLVRDQLKVGLQQFPEFQVTVGMGYRGINELRNQAFDGVFVGIDPKDKESSGLLQHLRSFDRTTELVVLAAPRSLKDMAADKGRFDIYTFLQTPIDPRELFEFIGRFRERHAGRSNGGRKQRSHPAGGKPQG
jgi:DNA-binding NtrC family response regulator